MRRPSLLMVAGPGWALAWTGPARYFCRPSGRSRVLEEKWEGRSGRAGWRNHPGTPLPSSPHLSLPWREPQRRHTAQFLGRAETITSVPPGARSAADAVRLSPHPVKSLMPHCPPPSDAPLAPHLFMVSGVATASS